MPFNGTDSPIHFNNDEQALLRHTAWESIDHGLIHHAPLIPSIADKPASLSAIGACFVTLKINDQLRGCIGSLEPRRPLLQDVAHNAYAAAFSDPRFPPLNNSERDKLQLDISVLTPAEVMHVNDEEDLLRQLVPGEDGLIIEDGIHRATFLPSVWESLPTPQSFVEHLKQKAGLPINYWSQNITISRYHTITV